MVANDYNFWEQHCTFYVWIYVYVYLHEFLLTVAVNWKYQICFEKVLLWEHQRKLPQVYYTDNVASLKVYCY